jgi:alpha-tubulin suppressor-like RCC1 family protein
LANIISVSAGNSHAAVVANNAVVWSWGTNQEGQIGDGTTTSRYSPVAVLGNVISVKTGGFHTLALLEDGTVAGWGKNNFGQLGNNGVTGARG